MFRNSEFSRIVRRTENFERRTASGVDSYKKGEKRKEVNLKKEVFRQIKLQKFSFGNKLNSKDVRNNLNSDGLNDIVPDVVMIQNTERSFG